MENILKKSGKFVSQKMWKLISIKTYKSVFRLFIVNYTIKSRNMSVSLKAGFRP